MTVQTLLQGAVRDALQSHAALAAVLTAVSDAPPVRAAVPHALVEDAVLTDWSTKDQTGREGRFAVIVRDEGERPVRLRALAGAVEEAVEAMAPDIGDGWRIVGVLFLRGRVQRDGGQWLSVSEFRVRMLRF